MGNTVSNYVNSFKNSQYYYTNYGPDSRLFQNGYNISTMLYNTGYVAPQYQYSYNPSRMNFPFQNDYNFGVFPNSFGYMNPQYQYGYNQGVLPFNTNLSSGGIDLTPTGFDAATFTTAPNNISTVDNTYVHSPDQVADSTPLEINISEKDLRKYKKELINDAAQAEMDAQGSLGTSMLFTVPFAAPAVIKAAKNLNNGASNIFHQLDNNGTAKYKDLWKSHPYQILVRYY